MAFWCDNRLRANEKMMVLNDTGLYEMLDKEDHTKKGKRLVVPKNEKDIFDAIGMKFVEPKDRER